MRLNQVEPIRQAIFGGRHPLLSELSLIMSIRAEFANPNAREYIKSVVMAELSPKMGKRRFANPAMNRITAARAWIPTNTVLSFQRNSAQSKGRSSP